MVTKEHQQTRVLHRHKEDTQDFIGHLLKGWFRDEADVDLKEAPNLQPGMVVTTTIQKPYTIDDFRRIIETPSHILHHYNLKFINDQVIVTVKVMKTMAQQYEEAIA